MSPLQGFTLAFYLPRIPSWATDARPWLPIYTASQVDVCAAQDKILGYWRPGSFTVTGTPAAQDSIFRPGLFHGFFGKVKHDAVRLLITGWRRVPNRIGVGIIGLVVESVAARGQVDQTFDLAIFE